MVLVAAPGKDLKHAEKEVKAIALEFRSQGPTILSGSRAREEDVVQKLPRADWIHFACHAHLDKESPRFSWLELSPSGAGDGRLEVHEIERLSLKARLVTLAACETGLELGAGGLYSPGEDLIGMGRAFLAAGAGTVVAALWDIPDRDALAIMSAFYSELAKTPDEPALALNRASLRLMSSGGGDGPRHPFLGAAFVAIGAGASSRALAAEDAGVR